MALFGFATLIFGPKLAPRQKSKVSTNRGQVLFGFELGLFFREIITFGRIIGKIGFVLHKKGWICKVLSTGVENFDSFIQFRIPVDRKQKTGDRIQKTA
ncbi:MAG: hypothetical protein JW837_07120 [Sedimentisphaerales bacterium]|nr:hypothetical protein [Sedimentisphaerales bacterium]